MFFDFLCYDHMTQASQTRSGSGFYRVYGVTLREGNMAAEGKLHWLAKLTFILHFFCNFFDSRLFLFFLMIRKAFSDL